MNINVLFFGSLADATGKSRLEINNVSDTETLRSKLLRDFPKLEKYKFVIAVCKHVVKANTTLHEGDTVAFLPPFAGG